MASATSGAAGKGRPYSMYDAMYKEQLDTIDAQLKRSQDEYNKALPRFLEEHEKRLRSLNRNGKVDEEEVRDLEKRHHDTWQFFIDTRNKRHKELLELRAVIQDAADAVFPAPTNWAGTMELAGEQNAQRHEARAQAKRAKEAAALAAKVAASQAKRRKLEEEEQRRLEERLAAMEAEAAAAEAEAERRRSERARRAAEEAEKERQRQDQVRQAKAAEAEKQRQHQEQARLAQEANARKEQEARTRAEREAKARKEQEARARKEKEPKARREAEAVSLDEARDRWERAWSALLAPKTRSAKELHYDDIPWPGALTPGKPIDLSASGLRRFLLEPTAKDRLMAKLQGAGKGEAAVIEALVSARLRTALLRFHPDKFFSSRCFTRVRNSDQERVRKGVVQVAQLLTALVCERRGAR